MFDDGGFFFDFPDLLDHLVDEGFVFNRFQVDADAVEGRAHGCPGVHGGDDAVRDDPGVAVTDDLFGQLEEDEDILAQFEGRLSRILEGLLDLCRTLREQAAAFFLKSWLVFSNRISCISTTRQETIVENGQGGRRHGTQL